ncbi:MAG: hypothetical protein WAV12_31915, partial [Trebonia sp.]|uniref:hypothetical protein n=1 Tax=Trebonia sp. TaxID=2767075 RepID=UPI003BB01476
AAALSMITKEKSPMRVLFFRDHEISGLRPAAAPSPGAVPEGRARNGTFSVWFVVVLGHFRALSHPGG